MKDLRTLDNNRLIRFEREYYGGYGGSDAGVFCFTSPCDRRTELRVIASNGEGWDHVSVSTARRCPNWEEMEHIKRIFFKRDEAAMQLHVPENDHISHHPYTLHIWRPHVGAIPLPPAIMVGPANG
jgi:hypothetical protein